MENKTLFIYRTSTLLIYFIFSMIFVFAPFFLLVSFNANLKEIIAFIALGGLFATVGGIEGLLWYGEWRNAQIEQQLIKKMVFIFYALPFWGMFIAFVIYITLNLFPTVSEDIRNITVLLCLLQLRILLRVFGKNLFSEDSIKES